MREAREELGVELKSAELHGVYSYRDDPRSPMVLVVFRATALTGPFVPGSDVTEAQYFALDSLPQAIAFDGNRRAIEDFSKRLEKTDSVGHGA